MYGNSTNLRELRKYAERVKNAQTKSDALPCYGITDRTLVNKPYSCSWTALNSCLKPTMQLTFTASAIILNNTIQNDRTSYYELRKNKKKKTVYYG